jgi:hypothetical protein
MKKEELLSLIRKVKGDQQQKFIEEYKKLFPDTNRKIDEMRFSVDNQYREECQKALDYKQYKSVKKVNSSKFKWSSRISISGAIISAIVVIATGGLAAAIATGFLLVFSMSSLYYIKKRNNQFKKIHIPDILSPDQIKSEEPNDEATGKWSNKD